MLKTRVLKPQPQTLCKVEKINEACDRHNDLRVKWLLDYNRGNRCNSRAESSRSILQNLVNRHPDNVNVSGASNLFRLSLYC